MFNTEVALPLAAEEDKRIYSSLFAEPSLSSGYMSVQTKSQNRLLNAKAENYTEAGEEREERDGYTLKIIQ